MVSVSYLQWIELLGKSSSLQIAKREESKAFLPCILIAFNQFEWKVNGQSEVDEVKSLLSRMLLDAGYDQFKRSRFSTTAVQFCTKALTYHSSNKYIKAARAARDYQNALQHICYFAEEMKCGRAFYKFKAWSESDAPGPLPMDFQKTTLETHPSKSS
jgi:hypothetical protein